MPDDLVGGTSGLDGTGELDGAGDTGVESSWVVQSATVVVPVEVSASGKLIGTLFEGIGGEILGRGNKDVLFGG